MTNNDCKYCWCNTCAELSECLKHRDGAKTETKSGKLRPRPCVGCEIGERYMPRKRITDEIPPDCFMPF